MKLMKSRLFLCVADKKDRLSALSQSLDSLGVCARLQLLLRPKKTNRSLLNQSSLQWFNIRTPFIWPTLFRQAVRQKLNQMLADLEAYTEWEEHVSRIYRLVGKSTFFGKQVYVSSQDIVMDSCCTKRHRSADTQQYNTVQIKFPTRARSHRNVNLRRGNQKVQRKNHCVACVNYSRAL